MHDNKEFCLGLSENKYDLVDPEWRPCAHEGENKSENKSSRTTLYHSHPSRDRVVLSCCLSVSRDQKRTFNTIIIIFIAKTYTIIVTNIITICNTITIISNITT